MSTTSMPTVALLTLSLILPLVSAAPMFRASTPTDARPSSHALSRRYYDYGSSWRLDETRTIICFVVGSVAFACMLLLCVRRARANKARRAAAMVPLQQQQPGYPPQHGYPIYGNGNGNGNAPPGNYGYAVPPYPSQNMGSTAPVHGAEEPFEAGPPIYSRADPNVVKPPTAHTHV